MAREGQTGNVSIDWRGRGRGVVVVGEGGGVDGGGVRGGREEVDKECINRLGRKRGGGGVVEERRRG